MQKIIRTVIYLFALLSPVLGSNECIGPINIVFVNNQPLCGPNEEFSNCGNLCEVTAENYGEALTDDPVNHPEMCKPNCYCEMGFYRHANGECVEDRNLEHKICDQPNEIFRRCGQNCQQYCDGPRCNYTTVATTPSGCYCRKNYERDVQTNICIRKNARRCVQQAIDALKSYNS